jgi:Fe-S cluster assembly protein SufD
MNSYCPILEGRWKKTLSEERDPFALMNLALHSSALFLYIPPHVKLQKPIQALFIGTQDCLAPARLQIFLGAHAKVEWISTTVGPALHNVLLDVALEEAASFEEVETTSKSLWHQKFLRATLKKKSHLKHLNLTHTSSRHSLIALLQEEEADVLLQGIAHLKDEEEAHTYIKVEHLAPNCHSLQKFKAVVDGLAQTSFSGKIYVHKEAEKTEAYQLSQSLLLTPGAKAQAKPGLEIFNPDVKASHGATVAQIDSEELFYLQSRGLTLEAAKHLLVRGFIAEMLNQNPHSFLHYDL